MSVAPRELSCLLESCALLTNTSMTILHVSALTLRSLTFAPSRQLTPSSSPKLGDNALYWEARHPIGIGFGRYRSSAKHLHTCDISAFNSDLISSATACVLLSAHQKAALVDHIASLCCSGSPTAPTEARELCKLMFRRCSEEDQTASKLGWHWSTRFRQRHPESINDKSCAQHPWE